MFSKSEGRDASFSVSGNGGGVPSIISADLKITGELISEGDIQLNGTLVGDVRSGSLTIGETAHVEGKISARELRVSGEVVGEVNAGEVALTKSARINGDIVHESLAIEPGADVEGHLRRQNAPKLKAVATASEETSGEVKANGSGESSGVAKPEPGHT
jgi:cytoskeletal protein CcmA (bactofilin family)